MNRAQMIELAQKVVAECGGQSAAASMLGVSQPSVSKALRATDVQMDKLRKRILEELGGYQVLEEMVFVVIEPERSRRVADPPREEDTSDEGERSNPGSQRGR